MARRQRGQPGGQVGGDRGWRGEGGGQGNDRPRDVRRLQGVHTWNVIAGRTEPVLTDNLDGRAYER